MLKPVSGLLREYMAKVIFKFVSLKGRDVFLRSKCPVDTCTITASRDQANTADMILYKDHYIPTGIRRPANSKQVTMLYYLECPYHTQNVKVPDAINWTATYR